jgi:hypothetical protein
MPDGVLCAHFPSVILEPHLAHDVSKTPTWGGGSVEICALRYPTRFALIAHLKSSGF